MLHEIFVYILWVLHKGPNSKSKESQMLISKSFPIYPTFTIETTQVEKVRN